ncbi:MAG: hypothetical protein GY874_11825, partial [Desulfobacteraceae bacterium]|nr:hypothetical protein [Desulfobacteraceae bacterium]
MTKIVFALGMHRSGTSALMAGLNKIGVDIGQINNLSNIENEKGYFENFEITNFNDRLLNYLGSSWDNLAFGKQVDYTLEKFTQPIATAKSLLDKYYSQKKIWGLKDPRLCFLLPFWQHVIKKYQLGEIYYVHIFRNPLEVAESLHKNFEQNPKANLAGKYKSYALKLWRSYYFQALRNVDNDRNIVLYFEDIIKDPKFELKRCADFLTLEYCDQKAEEYKNDFLDTKLKHHNFDYLQLEMDLKDEPQIIELFKSLTILKAEKEVNKNAIERIVSKFDEMKHVYEFMHPM